MLTLKEIFEKNKNIIINTDIDGILSGAILQKYYGCKIVGFTNSFNKIWVTPKIKDIYKPVYIDMFVNKPEVICIDQHIVSFNEEHHNKIKSYGTKINPNLERDRFFHGTGESSYFNKYPFGTVHYIMTLMEKEGISVDWRGLYDDELCAGEDFTPVHMLLRADGAFKTTWDNRYEKNANQWWDWLEELGGERIRRLKEYTMECDNEKVLLSIESVGTFLKQWSNIRNEYEEYRDCKSCNIKCGKHKKCEGSTDGSFFNICKEGKVLERFSNYIKAVGEMIDIKLRIPRVYSIYEGYAYRISCMGGEGIEFLNVENLFSYAFVRKPDSYENLSTTEEVEKIR